jgi:hypothetical protein
MQAEMVDRIAAPLWFHVGLGVLVAQQVLVSGLTDSNWTIASLAALLVGAAVLVGFARRSTGVAIAAPPGPRSRGLMTARFVVALASIWAAALVDVAIVVVILTIVALVATIVLGVMYDEALRRDLAGSSTAS